MTDAEHAAVLRHMHSADCGLPSCPVNAAIERAIELLEQQDDPLLWAAQNEPER